MSTLRVNNLKYVFHIQRKESHASRQLFHLPNLKLVFSISALAKKNYDGIIEKSLRFALIIVFLKFIFTISPSARKETRFFILTYYQPRRFASIFVVWLKK